MMQPGFYHMDCMDGMAQFPDKFFDLAIVDPPYGVGSVTYMPRSRKAAFGGSVDAYEITVATLDMAQRRGLKTEVVHGRVNDKTIRNFGDENISPKPEYFEELFRVSKHQIIWGGNYYILPPSRGFVIWKKSTVSETFSMAMAEYAWVSKNTNAKVWEGAPQGTKADPRIHPTQKPIGLYEWLLKMYANPGDKILDTHAGSASSLIACQKMGFEYWGFELDADYYAAAKERINRATAQMIMNTE